THLKSTTEQAIVSAASERVPILTLTVLIVRPYTGSSTVSLRWSTFWPSGPKIDSRQQLQWRCRAAGGSRKANYQIQSHLHLKVTACPSMKSRANQLLPRMLLPLQ